MVKTVGYFCRGALSLMFDRILNATLSEKVSTTGVTQENPELSLPPHSLDSHQTQNSEMKFWTDPTFLLPWRRANPLGRKGEKRVTNSRAVPQKSRMVRCSPRALGLEIWNGEFWRSLRRQKSYKDKLWIYHYKTLVEGSRRLTHIKISDMRTIKKSLAEH